MRRVGMGVVLALGLVLAANPLLGQASKFTATVDSVEIMASCAVAGNIIGRHVRRRWRPPPGLANIKTPGARPIS